MAVLIILIVSGFLAVGLYHLNQSVKRNKAARDAALRVETAKAVQRQRAADDAPGVTEAAAQDRPKRKHRKKAT